MLFPLNRGLHVVDSSSKAALGQTVFQAQINVGIMSSTFHQHCIWKAEQRLDRKW